jgi:hypothetical protein
MFLVDTEEGRIISEEENQRTDGDRPTVSRLADTHQVYFDRLPERQDEEPP